MGSVGDLDPDKRGEAELDRRGTGSEIRRQCEPADSSIPGSPAPAALAIDSAMVEIAREVLKVVA